MKNNSSNINKAFENSPNFPLAEVFGGAFAAMVFLYLIINSFSANKANSDLKITTKDIQGVSEFEWPLDGQGFVISCYSDRVRIEETGQEVFIEDVVNYGSPFLYYLNEKYERPYTNLVFLIFNGGNETFATIEKYLYTNCRNCQNSFILMNESMESTLITGKIPMYLEVSEEGDSMYFEYPDPFQLYE